MEFDDDKRLLVHVSKRHEAVAAREKKHDELLQGRRSGRNWSMPAAVTSSRS